jgi:hypothetical protein
MNKIAYAIVCATAMVMTCFAPDRTDRVVHAGFVIWFGVCCALSGKEKP